MWAVATACPVAREIAVVIGLVDSLAAAWALTEAFLASPTEAFPAAHSLAMERAIKRRSSISSPSNGKTCSTQDMDHLINC